MRNVDWDWPGNAEDYAAFCERHPLYRERAGDLCRLAGVGAARRVLDLGCGTGESTRCARALAPEDAEIVGMDKSLPMLARAKQQLDETRAMQAPLVELVYVGDSWPQERTFDASISNMAIWQVGLTSTLPWLRSRLRTGGLLAFNLGVSLVGEAEAGHDGPGQAALLAEQLGREVSPPAGSSGLSHRRPSLSWSQIQACLERSGFRLAGSGIVAYANSRDQEAAWAAIPVFARRVVPREEIARFLELAYDARIEELLASDWIPHKAAPRTDVAVFRAVAA